MNKFEFDSRLILEVESHPVLYNRSLPEYKLKNKNELAWQDIGSVLQRPSADCKKRWRGLRDTFSTNHRVENSTPSGSGATSSCRWAHYKSMMFLLPFVAVPSTQGNYKGKTTASSLPQDAEMSDFELHDSQSYCELQSSPSERQTEAKQRKERPNDVSEILNAISSVCETPTLTANQSFYGSIATRAETLAPRLQSLLQMKVLELLHKIEFGFEDE